MLNTTGMKKLLLVLCSLVPVMMFAQSGSSLQKITVSSVTLMMDSVRSAADVEAIKTTITKHQEVKDFDIKLKNCNFTIDNSHNTLDVIFSDLAQMGQPARVYSIEANQTFTRVPEENCQSKKGEPELKEADYLKSIKKD